MARFRWRAPYLWSVPSSRRNSRPSLVIRDKKGRVVESSTRFCTCLSSISSTSSSSSPFRGWNTTTLSRRFMNSGENFRLAASTAVLCTFSCNPVVALSFGWMNPIPPCSQIADLMHGGMGFIQPKDKATTGLHEKVQRTAVEAARRKFSPEFMNRLDKVVVFHPLKREELDEVLEIELRQVQKRVLDSTTRPFFFRITGEGREFLLEEGTDQRYGARHLKRAIERYVVYPIARLLATTQVHQGDALVIDHHLGEEGLVFLRDTENRSSALPLPNSRQPLPAEARL